MRLGLAIYIAAILFILCSCARAADIINEIEPSESDFVEITSNHEQSIERALDWLAKHQARDGSWSSDGATGAYQMAMTGLAGLAFLSAGHTPGRGKYSENVLRAIKFALKNQDSDGLFSARNDGQQMYGHGFAMTFLAEAYGMDTVGELNLEIKEKLKRAVRKSQQAQSSRGGWYYSPDANNDEGSVTITQVQALRSARNAAIEVPEKVIKQAIDYVRKSQNTDGGIRYSVGYGQTSSVALTAAGVEVFLMAGQYASEQTKKACNYLKANLDPRHIQGHDFYTNFYGSQAMHHIGGRYWTKYFEQIRNRLLSSQAADGSWRDSPGVTYGTAIGVLILSLPYQYLPIFQK